MLKALVEVDRWTVITQCHWCYCMTCFSSDSGCIGKCCVEKSHDSCLVLTELPSHSIRTRTTSQWWVYYVQLCAIRVWYCICARTQRLLMEVGSANAMCTAMTKYMLWWHQTSNYTNDSIIHRIYCHSSLSSGHRWINRRLFCAIFQKKTLCWIDFTVSVNINVRIWFSASHEAVESTKHTSFVKSAEFTRLISGVTTATANGSCW